MFSSSVLLLSTAHLLTPIDESYPNSSTVRSPLNKHPYCCPKTKKCLMAYFDPCDHDPTICTRAGQLCCPLTLQCAFPVPDRICEPPAACKETEYCSPMLTKCVTPSAKKCDKSHSHKSSCSGEFPVCDFTTERCVKLGANCTSTCSSQPGPPPPPPAPPAPPSPATKIVGADMCAVWGREMKWDCKDSDPCNWNHIECDGGNITGLYLHEKGLSGAIPSSIGLLTSLQRLDLRLNNLTGTIPTSIGNLVNLINLELRFNNITGPLPNGVCNMKKLVQMCMSGNPFTGPIPDCIGSLTSLNELSLENTKLSGELPSSIGQMTSLDQLELDNSLFSGVIPVDALKNLSNLGWLYLSGNNWTCPLPNITSPPWRDKDSTLCN